jgi:hypothetical protein
VLSCKTNSSSLFILGWSCWVSAQQWLFHNVKAEVGLLLCASPWRMAGTRPEVLTTFSKLPLVLISLNTFQVSGVSLYSPLVPPQHLRTIWFFFVYDELHRHHFENYYAHDIWRKIMKLYYQRRESSKILWIEFLLFDNWLLRKKMWRNTFWEIPFRF